MMIMLDLAEKISKEIILENQWLKGTKSDIKFFERLNSRLVTVKGFKLSYLINMLKISATNKNFKDMHKFLVLILKKNLE